MSAGDCTRKILVEHSVPQTLGRDPRRAVDQFSLGSRLVQHSRTKLKCEFIFLIKEEKLFFFLVKSK